MSRRGQGSFRNLAINGLGVMQSCWYELNLEGRDTRDLWGRGKRKKEVRDKTYS